MPVDPKPILLALQTTLYAAKNLLAEATSLAENNEMDAADAIVVVVLRVLDAYEAIAQLPNAHDIASKPDTPIPFHPVR